jgi:putative membrane protein
MAKPHLSQDDFRRVREAVTAAEANSAGEIVTIVAGSSDGYTDIALAWAAIVAFVAMGFVSVFSDFYFAKIDWLLGNWQHEWTLREAMLLVFAVGVAKFIGMMLVQLIRPLRIWLIPPPIKSLRTHHRAVALFKVAAERRTTGRTGILIYLSLDERRAEIVADEAIASKVEPEVWGKAMAGMLAHIKDGRIGEGMASAVGEVGKVLAEHFPRSADDRNELPDRLIEI